MKAKYKTLGLKKGASQEEIQEAYERLSKELDPASNNNDTFFVEQFTKVRAAYKALSQRSILSTNEEGRSKKSSDKRESKKKHNEDEISVKELNWFLKLFTIGDKFSFQDFFDRAKKMIVEFFAIFFGVFLSLAVDQKREDSNHRSDNINNMKKLKVELDEIIAYTDEHVGNLSFYNEMFEAQYYSWEDNSDSVFLTMYGEGEDAFAFAPLGQYESVMPFDPPEVTYKSVQLDGTFRFLDDTLEHELTKIYSGSDLFFIKENAYKVDQSIVDDFVSRISDRWVEDIGNTQTEYNEFWYDNREYIQKDFYMKNNLGRRLKNFANVTEQLAEHRARVEGAAYLLDSILRHKENEIEIIYWVVDFDFLHKE
tara:strand:- start:5507 stop:6610 length:1104 start_codon:yes stop_codon:yes gene_type:complete